MSIDPTAARGTPVLRQLNRASVLSAFRGAGAEPQRIVDLVKVTGLTRPTVAQAVTDLEAEGWLARHSPQVPGLGRPAARYSVNDRHRPILGLDIGPHTVSALAAGLSGEPLASAQVTVRRSTSRAVLDAIDAALDQIAKTISLSEISAVVAGTPGLLDMDTGKILMAPSVAGWPAIDLPAALTARIAGTIRIENDANLAALAIADEQEAPNQTLLAVQWGDRLGAGLIIAGHLHRGAQGAAGEIGFIAADPDQADADAHGRGALEHRIGAEAIGRQATEAGRGRARSALGRHLKETPEEPAAALFRAADDGDPTAQRLVTKIANEFADAIAPLILGLDPHAIVIGGGVSRAGPRLAHAISRRIGQLTLRAPEVKMSNLADRAVISGAVNQALETVWADAVND